MSTIAGKLWQFLMGSDQQGPRGPRGLLNEELIRRRRAERNVELESQTSTRGSGSASHQGEENPPTLTPSSRGLASHQDEEDPPIVIPSSTVLSIRKELQKAARDGDWVAFETKLQQNPDLIRATITKHGETILHLAVVGKHPAFIEQVVNRMEVEDLAVRDNQGNTAFLIAVIMGNMEAVVKMLSKNGHLLSVLGEDHATPLCKALYFEQMEIASYLYNVHNDSFTVAQLCDAFVTSIKVGKYDFALTLITNLHDIPDEKKIWEALRTLPGRPKDFLVTPGVFERICNYVLRRQGAVNPALRIVKDLWGRLNSADLSEGGGTFFMEKASEILFIAAKSGNMEFLTTIVNDMPELVNYLNDKDQTLFHVAVLHGQRSVLRLLYGVGVRTEQLLDTKDKQGENILHYAARYTNTGSDALSWPVVQLQEELLNFMEIQQFVSPKLRNERNKGRTEDGESGSEHRSIGGTEQGKIIGTGSGSTVGTEHKGIQGSISGSIGQIIQEYESARIGGPGHVETEGRVTEHEAIEGTQHGATEHGDTKSELGATPLELFLNQHADLFKVASKWIITTAGACLVVTSLNATIVFTGSPSKIPGEEQNGVPLSTGVERVLIQLFGAAHGFAILTSSVSLSLFLDLIMSRQSLKDFFCCIPLKLMISHICLLLAAITILVEFCSIFLLSFHRRFGWFTLGVGGSSLLWYVSTTVLSWPLLWNLLRLIWRVIRLKVGYSINF